MVDSILSSVQKIWNAWNIRGIVLLSLFLQILLTCAAPFRKSTRNGFVHFLVWSSYLLAQSTASFGIGLIFNSHGGVITKDLLTLWTPFLLIHLGSPDSITALSLEDNELWHRHLIAFFPQAGATLYVFLKSLPNNKLWVPSMLIFVVGVYKYLGRTRALYLASLHLSQNSALKEPDPGLNYDELMEVYNFRRVAELPTEIIHIPEVDQEIKPAEEIVHLDYSQAVYKANHYFETFKGFLVDIIVSLQDRIETREFFRKLEAESTLRVIEIELNLMYEAMYAKTRKLIGLLMQYMCMYATIASLIVFSLKQRKNGFSKFDKVLTYALHIGAISLEGASLVFNLYTDTLRWVWSRINTNLGDGDLQNTFRTVCKQLSALDKKFYEVGRVQRWSGSIPEYNLIRLCLNRSQNILSAQSTKSFVVRYVMHLRSNLITFFGLRDTLDSYLYVYSDELYPRLWEFLFRELKWKSNYTDDLETVKKISLARGDWVLKETETGIPENYREDLMLYLTGVRYDESLLLWHIATVLCHHHDEAKCLDAEPECPTEVKITNDAAVKREECNFRNYGGREAMDPKPECLIEVCSTKDAMDPEPECHIEDEIQVEDTATKLEECRFRNYNAREVLNPVPECLIEECPKEDEVEDTAEELEEYHFKTSEYRVFSLILSDYMMYLLIMQPGMMSAVAVTGKIRFQDTCAAAEQFFSEKGLKAGDEKKACEEILAVDTTIIDPAELEGNRSQSVLFDASILAKKLIALENEHGVCKWMLLSKIWVEMLSYGTINCSAYAHVKKLCKGGELITHVWLLMAHLGLREMYLSTGSPGGVKFDDGTSEQEKPSVA